MSYVGLVMGVIMLVAVGLGHVLVIRWEYHLGVGTWWLMMLLGVGVLVGSLFAGNVYLSGALGLVAATLLWGVKELFEQGRRVERGLYPRNPRRRK